MDDPGISRLPTLAMTNDIFSKLAGELDRRSRGGPGALALERLGAHGASVEDVTTLSDLVRQCHESNVGAVGLVADLIKLAPDDELLALAALVALRPALRRVARRVGGHGADQADVDQTVLASAWGAIRAPGTEKTASAVVSHVWSETWSQLRRVRRSAERELLCEPSAREWICLIHEDASADVGLGRPLTAHTLSQSDLQLVRLVRIVGVPLREVARTLAVPKSTLEYQLQRVERSLRVTYRGSR